MSKLSNDTSKEDPTPNDTGSTGTSDTSREQMPQSGSRLGHCRIVELIAGGGMANVYKVWHEQLEVIRALKILKPGYTEESKGRLETEAKISANLRHTNIVEIYGMGYWHSIPYIEMEYVDGPSLKELVDQSGRLPLTLAIAITHFVCQALEFAYKQDLTLYGKVYDGLIHRDIKPANILLTAKGVIKLADFGIARPSEVSLHTVGSKVMGTFAYLSPEQLNGEKLDQRSDVYSLGTVLYEMITGTKTFPQKMLAELVQRKSRGQYVPIESMGIEIPKMLCHTIDKSLVLDREKRYNEMLEFDNDLIAVFKKITTKSPEDVIRAYLKNPPGTQRSNCIVPTHSVPKVLSVIGTIALILAICIAGTFVVYKYPLLTKTKSFKTISIDHDMGKNIPIDSTIQNPSTVVKTHLKSSTGPRSKTSPSELLTNAQLKVGLLSDGFSSFAEKKYDIALSSFLKNFSTIENHDTQNLVRTRILECALKTDNLESAKDFLQPESPDAYFFLLKGTYLYKKQEYEPALIALQRAQTIPSRLNTNVQRDALYLWAKIKNIIYERQPSKENKTSASRSWKAFLNLYCATDESSECSDAKAMVLELEK